MKLNCALKTSVERKKKILLHRHWKIRASLHPVMWIAQLTAEKTNLLTLWLYIWFCFVKIFSSFIKSIRQAHGLNKRATHSIKH